MMFGFSRLSLLWKTLLSTSIAITLLFAVTVWIVQQHVVQSTSESLEDEVRASFRAYESLWRAHADKLASISLILSTMSDVRAAFTTGDEATIRDTAAELWNRVSEDNAIFLVTDPNGGVITSLGGNRAYPHAAEPCRWCNRRPRVFPGHHRAFSCWTGVCIR